MTVSGTGFKNYNYIDLEQKNGAAYLDIEGNGTLNLKLGDGTLGEYQAKYV